MVTITRNINTLDALCERLTDYVPDVPALSREYFATHNVDKRDVGDLAGRIMEMGAVYILHQFMDEYHIEFPEISGTTENYVFDNNGPNTVIYDRKTRNHLGDLDIAIIVDGMPVVFEVKSGKYKQHSGKKKSPSNFGTRRWMREGYKVALKAMEEYFESEAWYAIIVPGDYADHSNMEKTVASRFVNEGGKFVPIGIYRKELRRVVQDLMPVKVS